MNAQIEVVSPTQCNVGESPTWQPDERALMWPVSLECRPIEGRGFYIILAGAAVAGLLLDFLGVNPVLALYWTAVINGIISAPIMVVLMLMTTNREVMGREVVSVRLRTLGWIATAVIFAASLGLFWSWAH